MIASSTLAGVWSATVTPLTEHFVPDGERALSYYRELLETGCDGLNILGTSGEAMSLCVRSRIAFMEELIAGGIPAKRVMFGTGACALDDAVELNRTAAALGVSAALIMPPFFYRPVDDDGVLRFFDVLFARVETAPVLLYNFPRMSGITFHAELVERLMQNFPGKIAGMKDSSNDTSLQAGLLACHPELRIFTGSEEFLAQLSASGGAGCISGSVALWPQLAADVYRTLDPQLQAQLSEKRRSLPQALLIPAVREAVAKARNDDAWLRAVPPL